MSTLHGPWHSSWLASFMEDTVIEFRGEETSLSGPTGSLSLRTAPEVARDLTQRLGGAGSSIEQLVISASDWDIPKPQARLMYYLQKLLARGFLRISANNGDDRLASLYSMNATFALTSAEIENRPLVLSRFACIRRELLELVVESPCSAGRIVIHHPLAAQLLYTYSIPQTLDSLQQRVPGLGADAYRDFATLLLRSQFLVSVDQNSMTTEDSDRHMLSWEFHDLLFHMRSRGVRFDGLIGGTFRFAGEFEQPPPVKPRSGTATTPLYRPDLESIQRDDPPFSRVVESRKSVREFGDESMNIDQLGEFLYRVARVKEKLEFEVAAPSGPVRIETTKRPYPSGGGLYELEFYPVVKSCRGLNAGLYHYDPLEHCLELVSEPSEDTSFLCGEAGDACDASGDNIQVLIIVAARFQRLTWKYSGIGYALMLKHVGVVYESMYLTATAMNLGGCALGLGDPEVFSRAIKSNLYEETSLGEFLLGSLPTSAK